MSRGRRRGRKRRPEPPGHGGIDAPAGRFAEPLLNEFPAAELDLHGSTVTEAERKVMNFVQTEANRRPGAVVRIVTGKGLGSDGAAVLPVVVERVLRSKLGTLVAEVANDPFGGAMRVRLR